MNILFLEDRGSVTEYIKEILERDNKHRVIEAFDINDAQSSWEDRTKQPIHCMIIDLNMPADGLTEVEEAATAAGLLTGWIWLREYVFKVDPGMKARTIIFSDYLAEFKDRVPEEECRGISIIAKRSATPIESLLAAVEEITKKR
ncbi:hypothetical protein [uncultured Paludibaculum sp.]|uniref:hypothetical protein n=1 Tax=uncultured Paludibaculum sp. TaxID=1765020 RepID=UPI002AAA7C89|nr:hypothetical protein [uncultured Paludibaculum sp.]